MKVKKWSATGQNRKKNRLKEADGINFDESRLGRVIVTSVTVDAEGEKRIGKKKGYVHHVNSSRIDTDDEDGMMRLSQCTN